MAWGLPGGLPGGGHHKGNQSLRQATWLHRLPPNACNREEPPGSVICRRNILQMGHVSTSRSRHFLQARAFAVLAPSGAGHDFSCSRGSSTTEPDRVSAFCIWGPRSEEANHSIACTAATAIPVEAAHAALLSRRAQCSGFPVSVRLRPGMDFGTGVRLAGRSEISQGFRLHAPAPVCITSLMFRSHLIPRPTVPHTKPCTYTA